MKSAKTTMMKALAWIAGLAFLVVVVLVVFLMTALGLRFRREAHSIKLVSSTANPQHTKTAHSFQVLSDSPQWRGKSVIIATARAKANAGEVMEAMKSGTAILITEDSKAAAHFQMNWQGENALTVTCEACPLSSQDMLHELESGPGMHIIYLGFPPRASYTTPATDEDER